jgi:hypothetical protein
MSGTKEARTNSTSISDDNSTSLWRENTEPDTAVNQKGKNHPLLYLRGGFSWGAARDPGFPWSLN